MGGLSLAQTGALLGHKSAQTTLRYADHRQDAIRGYTEQIGSTIAAMQPGNPSVEIVPLHRSASR